MTIQNQPEPTTAITYQILRRQEVAKRLGISRSTLASWQDPKSAYFKPNFPKKIQLGANSVGYLESEINAFITQLAQNRV